MSSALLKLREQSRLFSTTEQEIAEHILSNPQLVVDMSIHQSISSQNVPVSTT